MGCESNYQISNPSNQFIIQGLRWSQRSFYTHSKKLINLPFMGETLNSFPFPAKGTAIIPAIKLNP